MMARVETRWSSAEIYLHGAHVTGFQKTGEPPLLFTSDSSHFESNSPIRGGVPVIFPWFGPRDGHPAHGYARTTEWELHQTALMPDETVRLAFRLPESESFRVEYIVTVGAKLTLELLVSNSSTDQPASFETCLHTYFHVGEIAQVAVHGLAETEYFDKVAGENAREGNAPLRIDGEVDRVYQDTVATVEITDPVLQRVIRIAKSGSQSTVVWNPWITKSAAISDLGNDDYLQFLCVESGNVRDGKLTLAPGECAAMAVEISS